MRRLVLSSLLILLAACGGPLEPAHNEPPPGDPIPGAPALGDPVPGDLALEARHGQQEVSGFSLGNAVHATSDAVLDVAVLPAWLSVSPDRVEVPPGAIRDFVVAATCGAVDEVRTHDVVLATNDPDEPTRTVSVTLACTSAPDTDFSIELVPSGSGMTPERLAVFAQAAERWAEVIVGDIPGANLDQETVDWCGDYTFEGTVDDVLIFATIAPIDGPGGVLGQAGPCLFSSPTAGFPAMPVAGIMTFDSDDVPQLEAAGTFVDVILHEMGHVLHLSRYAWEDLFDLLEYSGSSCLSSATVGFTGVGAVAEWDALGGSGTVPVEDNGVAGTGCSHWDDETFGNELMTGYLSLDSRLSRVTVGALGDVGFDVDLDAAEPYSLPLGTMATADAEAFREVLLAPRGVVHPDGTATPLPVEPDRVLEVRVAHGHAPDDHAHPSVDPLRGAPGTRDR